jgi:hypothetical protein
MKKIGLPTALFLLTVQTARAQMDTELQPETLGEFESYVESVEATIQERTESGRSFLWLDDNAPQKAEARAGDIVVHQFEGDVIEVRKGLIHHWLGAMFVPEGKLQETVNLLQDFERHEQIYPEVVVAELLEKEGNIVRSRLKTKKKKVLTVVLDMELEAHHQDMSEQRYAINSYSTTIREVKNPGTSEELRLPDGKGTGFLWRLYSYWRLEQVDDGVFVELETVSLTRDIPFGMGFIIKPFIQGVPRESLESTLQATRAALMN